MLNSLLVSSNIKLSNIFLKIKRIVYQVGSSYKELLTMLQHTWIQVHITIKCKYVNKWWECI